jgi:peptide/nickel transport system ATP-binding protein
LKISDLTVRYRTGGGVLTALDSVNLKVGTNEFVAVVGESGCGKTTLGLAVIGLLPERNSEVAGAIEYKGSNLLALDRERIKQYRGTEIAMIFQDPLTSLNPVYRIGTQMAEGIALRRSRKDVEDRDRKTNQKAGSDPSVAHSPQAGRGPSSDIKDEIIEWLGLVRIADPEQIPERYPLELSGGMTQRVMIAMALSQEPALLIADEPTTALDVTTQAQVLRLMAELMKKVNTSVLLITHDLAVASQVADRIVVMYAGEIVEDAEVHRLFSEPKHPYTKGLLSCLPNGTKDNSTLRSIPGTIPDLRGFQGCKFTSRCPFAFDRCRSERPQLLSVNEEQRAACFLYES